MLVFDFEVYVCRKKLLFTLVYRASAVQREFKGWDLFSWYKLYWKYGLLRLIGVRVVAGTCSAKPRAKAALNADAEQA